MDFRKWIFLPVFLILAFCNAPDTKGKPNQHPAVKKINYRHRSITFVIGEDKSTNKYYTNAAQYFRQHDTGENNQVIISPLSLVEILNYLNTIPANERWDKINIVSHGNSWTGLAIKILPHGNRTMLETILDAQKENKIPRLRTGIYDEKSHVVLYACGLGLDKPLMYKLQEIFSADRSPKITSTKLFNIFSVGPSTSAHSLAYFYNSFYKPNHYLGKHNLAKQLTQRYPDEDIDWLAALSRKLPKEPGQPFSYKYYIPIHWTEVYQDKQNRPRLKTEDDIISWILNQPEFLHLVEDYGIPLNKYQWSVRYINYTNDLGETKPAMSIKGKTVVMSVLKELIDPETKEPYVPALDNEEFFMSL